MFQMRSLVSRYKHDAPASEFSKNALAGASCLYLSRRHNRDRATNWLALRNTSGSLSNKPFVVNAVTTTKQNLTVMASPDVAVRIVRSESTLM